jgi:hypothetical protein
MATSSAMSMWMPHWRAMQGYVRLAERFMDTNCAETQWPPCPVQRVAGRRTTNPQNDNRTRSPKILPVRSTSSRYPASIAPETSVEGRCFLGRGKRKETSIRRAIQSVTTIQEQTRSCEVDTRWRRRNGPDCDASCSHLYMAVFNSFGATVATLAR